VNAHGQKKEDQKKNLCLCEVQSETEEVKQQKSKKVESQMPKKTKKLKISSPLKN